MRNNAPAFTGFIDALLALAREEEARPLARTAAHRELARLCQELLGRLTDAVATEPARRVFAGALLDGVGALTKDPSRWRATLERFQPPLEVLAGPYAAGRTARATPRLPPRLDAMDHATPAPEVSTFLVVPRADGALEVGAPWERLLARARTATAAQAGAAEPDDEQKDDPEEP